VRISVAVLAQRLRVARSMVQARLERLEATGAIAGYTLRLGQAAHATRIRAKVLLGIEPRSPPGLLVRLKAIPQVERVHTPADASAFWSRSRRVRPPGWTIHWTRSAGSTACGRRKA